MNQPAALVSVAATACLGVWLVVTGWRQPHPSLDHAIRRLRRTPVTTIDGRSWQTQIGQRLLGGAGTGTLGTGRFAGILQHRTARWSTALRLIGRTTTEHVGLLAVAAAAGFVVPPLVLAVLQLLGVLPIAIWIPVACSPLAAAVAVWIVHADAMSTSSDRRIDVRHQLSAYLDMVTMLLAGNTGHEGALEQAARAGDGMLFRELRRRMREVGMTGNSLTGALSIVGADFGVIELEQVASAATLSAAEGAPVARTLAAKCSTLRSTLAAEQEASARIRTDKVTPPLVGMALLFMALIIYPALDLQ